MKKYSVQSILFPVLLTAMGLGAQTPTTLRAAANRVNLNFGMAVKALQYNGDSTVSKVLKTQCNIFVNENVMKFQYVEPERGRFDFSQPDVVVTFAEANNIKMRGHTLLWDSQIGWAGGLTSGREDVLKVIKTHIDSTMGYYKGRILEWDVVNEPVGFQDTSTQLRNSVWVRNVGPDFIDSALVYARKADPTAKLFINDFWVEYPCPKAETFFKLAKGLKDRGIPLDGVGFQCHTGNNISKLELSKLMKRYADIGLMVSLTEVDVHLSGTQPSGWKSMMEACLENPNCKSFLTWGTDDPHSWLTKNGVSCDCLLFDANFQPKLNVSTLINAMNAANMTTAAARKTWGATGVSRKTRNTPLNNSNMIQTSAGIKYTLSKTANVRLDLITMSGKKVATLVNTRQSTGERTVVFDRKNFSPGLYLVELSIDGKQEVSRVVVGR